MTDHISVIIRSMRRTCLAESIASAVNQAIEELEIIVVDALGHNHPDLPECLYPVKIRLISIGKSLSRPAAANVGMSAAKGDLLIFLDDDDLFLEGHLSGLRNILIAHPEAVACYSGVHLIDTLGNEIDVYNAPFNTTSLLGHNVFPINAVLFRRYAALDCEFDENLDVYEDWDFWLQLIRQGPFVHHNAITAVYRIGLSQSGLNNVSNKELRSAGRNRIYQKWKSVWSGEEWNAFIESKLHDSHVLRCELAKNQCMQARLQAQLSEVVKALRDTQPALDNTRQRMYKVEQSRKDLMSQLDNSQKLVVRYMNERDELFSELENKKKLLGRLEGNIDHIENELEISREHLAVIEKEREQLRSALEKSCEHLRVVENDRDNLERDRDYYRHVFLEIRQSTFWRLTGPLRYSLSFIKTFNPTKDTIWNMMSWGFHKFPASDSLKRKWQDILYQRFPRLFQHLPSYQFRVLNISPIGLSASSSRIDSASFLALEDLLPSGLFMDSIIPDLQVDIIIPVYDGIETTRRCLGRVVNAKTNINHRIIIINDSSPRPEILSLLKAIPQNERVLVINNGENLGFTATVNRGMSLSNLNDVVLLNSDTEVPDGWLDRLVTQAYRSSVIGTVTPFSNNATICSYPKLPGQAVLPDGETLDSLDLLIQEANRNRYTDLPTAVGFCMYIKRGCLNSVGLFDVETFGKGYGEENDFCLRASIQGWRHILAADVFVYHSGEASFGTGSSPAKQRAAAIIRERYPDYEANIADFVRKDPIRPWRIALTAARLSRQKTPKILLISHGLGGGVDKHLRFLARVLSDQGARVLILRSLPGQSDLAALELVHGADEFNIKIPTGDQTRLAELIETFGVGLVHIHHTMHWSIDMQALLARLGLPFLFTVHDYYTLCPRVNLMGPPHSAYCGEPDPIGCLDCLKESPRTETTDIINWRARHAWLFHDALRIICPSQDVASRCMNYYPQAHSRIRAVLHESLPSHKITTEFNEVNSKLPLRVMILGVLARHKGLDLVLDLCRLAVRRKSPIQFILVGFSTEIIPKSLSGIIAQTGAYSDKDLNNLIREHRPHLVWFPSRCPETYSYTLTTAMEMGLPIYAPRLGAFPERLHNYPHAWGYDPNMTTTELLSWLEHFKNLRHRGAWPDKDVPPSPLEPIAEDASWYPGNYLALLDDVDNCRPFDLSHDVNSVIIVAEMLGSHPSPCGYIRLMIPLASCIPDPSFRFASPEASLHYRAKNIITQRLAFSNRTNLDGLLKKVGEENCRLIYDLDDDLLGLNQDHGEADHYDQMKDLVTDCIKNASEVWVSTTMLANRIARLNSHYKVIDNRLGTIVWHLSEEVSDDQPTRILYMGTKTHRSDWQIVEPALKRLIHRHGPNVEIHVVGVDEANRLPSWVNVHQPPPGIAEVYPAFVNWLQNLMQFSVGIAPLMPDVFNMAKSGIKFMDYTALGAITLASDLPPYQEVIRHGENGLLVLGQSSESWEQALESVIGNNDLRQKLLRQARQDWLLHHSFNSSTKSYSSNSLSELLKVRDERERS